MGGSGSRIQAVARRGQGPPASGRTTVGPREPDTDPGPDNRPRPVPGLDPDPDPEPVGAGAGLTTPPLYAVDRGDAEVLVPDLHGAPVDVV